MKGHWTGIFSDKGGETEIDFTEDIIAKKIFMKPFVKGYIKNTKHNILLIYRKCYHNH